MIRRAQHTQTADADKRPKWFNSPVMFHEGSLSDIRTHIPTFERRGFGLTQMGNEKARPNDRLDTIVRLPFGEDETVIPVGVVSKDYALVPHTAVLDVAIHTVSMPRRSRQRTSRRNSGSRSTGSAWPSACTCLRSTVSIPVTATLWHCGLSA